MNDLPHESDPSLVGNDYVLSRTGLSRYTLARWMKANRFPQQHPAFAGTQNPCRWIKAEVNAWLRGEWKAGERAA